MNFIKKHKLLLIFLAIIVIIIIVFAVVLKDFLFSSNSGTVYGNRLSELKTVTVTDGDLDDALTILEGNEMIVSSKYVIQGGIINFIVLINEEIDVEDARILGANIISELNSEVTELYDVQIFIDTEEESEMYPIIGYKHKTSLEAMWSYYGTGEENEEE